MNVIRNLEHQKANNLKMLNGISKLSNSIDVTRRIRQHFDSYIKDIENITKLNVGKHQKIKLENYIQNNRTMLKPIQIRKKLRTEFQSMKQKLIFDWEKETGHTWPRYKNDVYYNGKLVRNKGCNYDVHHIVELSYGGPPIWWNIHPAASPNQHQNGIHRKDGMASKIFIEGAN